MKKKVLLLIMILVLCMSLLCACGDTSSKTDPSTTDTNREQTESEKQEETENNTPAKDTAYPKASRENKDILSKYAVNFAQEVRNAYSAKYGDDNAFVANSYGFFADKEVKHESYVFFIKVGKETAGTVDETVSGITFHYKSNCKMSVYEAKSKTICDMVEAYEKGLLTASNVKNIKHKCDMEDFAAGEGLPLLETYRKFVGVEDKVALGEMEILDYFGVYHGVHVAVIDDHYGVHTANYPQYDISGYWFYGIRESMFVAYKDGEMKYMCAPAEKGWYVANEWLTKEDIAAINEKHLKHLEYDYE
ncbi:MAG: hypothetical protein HFK09_07720 [Clostridia bacterium]|nr:hypothetical protein [Clostridia bacterium]